MNLRALLPFASILLLAACGGASDGVPSNGDPSSPASSTETGTVSVPNVGDVRAARVTDRRTQDASSVAAFSDHAKVERAIELLGLKGTLAEATALPNCIADVSVELFDAAGKVAATAFVYCGKTNLAILQVGDKSYTTNLSDLDALVKLEGDRTLIANWLYEVSTVEIDQPLKDQHRVLSTREEIDQAIGALSAVDTFDPSAPRTKCAADYAVTFTRVVGEGEPVKTHLYITCGSDPKASQPGWFQATDALDGQVTVNALAIANLANAPTTVAKQ